MHTTTDTEATFLHLLERPHKYRIMKAAVVMMVLMVASHCWAQGCVCPYHVPIEQRGCPVPGGCRGGLVMDFCNCCMACAKVVGETCGGEYQKEGICGRGLFCNTTADTPEYQTRSWKKGICSYVPNTTPRASYPGYGSNPYASTLYPSLQPQWNYPSTPPRRPGGNIYQGGGFYPAGQQTTTGAGNSGAPIGPHESQPQLGMYPYPTTAGTGNSRAPAGPDQIHHQGGMYPGGSYVPITTPRASYPGYGSNPYASTLYPSLQPQWNYPSTPPRRSGGNIYQGGGFYPAGQQTTTGAGNSGAPTGPHESQPQLGMYPYPTTARTTYVHGGATQADRNSWQSFYPTGIATTTARTRHSYSDSTDSDVNYR